MLSINIIFCKIILIRVQLKTNWLDVLNHIEVEYKSGIHYTTDSLKYLDSEDYISLEFSCNVFEIDICSDIGNQLWNISPKLHRSELVSNVCLDDFFGDENCIHVMASMYIGSGNQKYWFNCISGLFDLLFWVVGFLIVSSIEHSAFETILTLLL